jgi:hypothetical protein
LVHARSGEPAPGCPEEAAEAAGAFKPRILYPYHQNSGDPDVVKTRLAGVAEIEVRVRRLP